MSAIEVKNLVKKFHGQTVLHGIDLEVKEGEVVAIIGPSGSGKTTLLRSINLLEQPESGTIRVGDITIDTARPIGQQKGLIRRLRQHVGFVFQSFNLFPQKARQRVLLAYLKATTASGIFRGTGGYGPAVGWQTALWLRPAPQSALGP